MPLGAGWTIAEWPDDDAMLDQLVAITAPENAAELQRRSALRGQRWRTSGGRRCRRERLYDDLRRTACCGAVGC